jgi:hypothetical protein
MSFIFPQIANIKKRDLSYSQKNNCKVRRRSTSPSSSINPFNSKQETVGQFILGKTLGQGTFGKVKLGIHSITGEKVSINNQK